MQIQYLKEEDNNNFVPQLKDLYGNLYYIYEDVKTKEVIMNPLKSKYAKDDTSPMNVF